MEGKLTYLRTLPKHETEQVFTLLKEKRDTFISVDKTAANAYSRQQNSSILSPKY